MPACLTNCLFTNGRGCFPRVQAIKKLLRGENEGRIDVNAADYNGDAYIHVLVRRITTQPEHKLKDKRRKAALECLWTFLVYCDSTRFDINIASNRDGNTALHIAVLVRHKSLVCEVDRPVPGLPSELWKWRLLELVRVGLDYHPNPHPIPSVYGEPAIENVGLTLKGARVWVRG